jgi:hypothetical protein
MNHTLSRILAAIELAALLIPASGRALLGAVLVWVDPFGKSVFPVDLFVILLVAIAAMAGLPSFLRVPIASKTFFPCGGGWQLPER